MFSRFTGQKYRHLNTVWISRSALERNHQSLQKLHPECRIAPVLKSNAYGHGLTTVAPIFDQLQSPFLIVDSLYEAYELSKLKLKTPVLILGYTHPDNFRVKPLPFQVAVFDYEVAQALNAHQKNCQIHLFVDTGMHREGISLQDLPSFLQAIKKLPNLKTVGLTSHLADADNPADQTFTQLQIKRYKKALGILRKESINPQYRHLSASGGALKLHDPDFNIIRAGLASYGLTPLTKDDPDYAQIELVPALRFTSTLAQIKHVQPGDCIGYNGTHTIKGERVVGLLPLGYYEGVDRRLSNIGVVSIRGVECRILGRVSMNMTTIDLSAVQSPQVGEEVVIYSDNPTAANSLARAAQTANTIPYELLVHLAESVRRKVTE